MAASDPSFRLALHERIPSEAMRLIEAASAGSLILRVSGSVAVRLRSGELAPTIDALGRRMFRDIDLWGYSKDQHAVEHLLEANGYVSDPQMKHAREWGVKRLIFEHPDTHVHVDVFMDELVMSHTIDFKGRLSLDSPTVPLADLLLSKLQIHEITENDLIDIAVLMATHDFGPDDPERIDLGHIAGLLRANWGFYHTTVGNIEKCDEALKRFHVLASGLVATVRERLQTMRDGVEAAPKSTKWRLRARVGTRAPWYETVEEVDR